MIKGASASAKNVSFAVILIRGLQLIQSRWLEKK
jgi:hypothetical protein